MVQEGNHLHSKGKNLITITATAALVAVLSGCAGTQAPAAAPVASPQSSPQTSQQSTHQTSQQHSAPTSAKGMGWTHKNAVTPTAGTWKGLTFKDGSAYRVEAPTANDSAETKKELADVKALTQNRTAADVEFIKLWQNTPSPNTLWLHQTEQLINKYGLMGPESARVHAVLSGAIYTSLTATFQAKYEYLRPRPTDLDPTITLPEGMSVPPHPSYPSGHTATAWTAAYILSHFFPNEKAVLEDLAAKVALSREQMGIHVKSENEAAKKIAASVTRDIIESLKDDNAPTQYTQVKNTGSGGHGGH